MTTDAKPYQKLSIQEKRELDLSRVREPAVACPACGTQTMPADLLAHMEHRCRGDAAPGPGWKWITWAEARALGVPGATLTRWVRHGFVRAMGERQDRKYLHRDLVAKVAQRRGFRRR